MSHCDLIALNPLDKSRVIKKSVTESIPWSYATLRETCLENATVPLPYATLTNRYIHYLFASTIAHDDFEIGYEIIPDLFVVNL